MNNRPGPARIITMAVLIVLGVMAAGYTGTLTASQFTGTSTTRTPEHAGQPQAAPPAPAPTPPPVLTRAQAAKIYLRYVGPANAAAHRLDDNTVGITTMETWRAEGTRARAAQRRFLDTLTTTRWPANVQPHADLLAQAVGQNVRYFAAITRAHTYDDLPYPADYPSTTAGEADVIRSLLHLPTTT